MHPGLISNASCGCGHHEAAHEHYRGGSECALCADCAQFQSAVRVYVPEQRTMASRLLRPRWWPVGQPTT